MITDITNEEYRKLPGLASSDIKLFWRSPAHYCENRDNPPVQTTAQTFGIAAHMATLQPDLFAKKYIAINDADICARIGGAKPRATNKYKDWKYNFILDNPGKVIIDLEDYKNAAEIARAVRAHSVAGALLAAPGIAEGVLQWNHPGTGTLMKCRPDWLIKDDCRIVDLKTCEDARPTAFAKQIWNYLYHLQAGFYIEGVHMTIGEYAPFTFIAVENKPPYGIKVYDLDEATVQLALSEIDRCIRGYEQCVASNTWPAYKEESWSIGLPAWAAVTEVA